MTTRDNSSKENTRWVMGIIAVLFTALTIGSVTAPYSILSRRIDDLHNEVKGTVNRFDMDSKALTEMKVDIRYIKEAIGRLEALGNQ